MNEIAQKLKSERTVLEYNKLRQQLKYAQEKEKPGLRERISRLEAGMSVEEFATADNEARGGIRRMR